MYVIYGGRISLKFYKSRGEDKESQLSSFLTVIHIAGAMKNLLKSLQKLSLHTHHGIKKGLVLLTVYMPQTEVAG